MGHEKAKGWDKTIDGKKIYYNKPSVDIKNTKEQQYFFSKTFGTEEEAVEVKKEKIKTVETKVKTKIKEIKVDEIKVAKIKTTLFSDQPNLDTYSNVSFYAPEALNYKVNDAFFEQMSLDIYNKQIYTNISLSGYIQNDPVEVHRKKMEEITIKKRTLMIELQQLKGN